jgi:D-3-phosphoglycerate dehydrogenase
MIKIGYLIRVRPDLEDIIPKDVQGTRIQVGDDGLYTDEDLAKIADVDAFVIGMEPVNEQILSAAKNLKIVQRLGVGYETLDLKACAAHNVPACNIEGVNKEAVAEHAMMFILAMYKRLFDANAFTQKADWFNARKLTTETHEVKDKTLGIIGFGNTGSALAKRAHAFEMDIIYNDLTDVNTDLAKSLGARRVEKDEIYQTADFVSICTDLNEHSRGMIDAQALAKMRPDTRFVCCARGGIIDEAALADALKSGQIHSAAVDVFETEPVAADNPLIGLPNCMLTAHVAGVASETTARIWEWAHENVRRVVVKGEKPNWIRNGL